MDDRARPADDDLPEHFTALAAEAGRWPRQMAELTDTIADEVAAALHGLTPAQHRMLACRVVTRLTREFGGAPLYVPKGDAIARALRNMAIWAAHDGTVDGPRGIRALAREHGLTDVAIWGILRAERAMHRPRQPARSPQSAPDPKSV